MPDGSTIRTVGEAAEYATSLPRKIGNTEPWQRAAKPTLRRFVSKQQLMAGIAMQRIGCRFNGRERPRFQPTT
jgi:hypothetical protein